MESTLTRTPIIIPSVTGKLVALSAARRGNGGDGSLKVMLSRRSHDNGNTWDPTVVVLEDLRSSPGGMNLGAVLTDHMTGEIMVVYSHCAHDCEIPKTYLIKSKDEGETWGNPVELNVTKDIKVFAPGPGHGIQVRSSVTLYLVRCLNWSGEPTIVATTGPWTSCGC